MTVVTSRLLHRSLGAVGLTLLFGCAAAPAPGAESPTSAALPIRALSFNIRYGTAADGDNHWDHRGHPVLDIIRQGDWDFIGLQEALLFQVGEILSAAPEYDALMRTRDADPARGETCALLYRRDRWGVDESGTFWLSESPSVAGSRSWDAALPRIATWALFEERQGGAALHVVNTHFDHRGQEARERSARLLRQHVEEHGDGRPVIVLGDFNSGEGTRPIVALTAAGSGGGRLFDSWRLLHPAETESGTFNGWQGVVDGPKIDFVFVSDHLEVLDAAIDRRSFGGRYPSDHYPVSATIRAPSPGAQLLAEPRFPPGRDRSHPPGCWSSDRVQRRSSRHQRRLGLVAFPGEIWPAFWCPRTEQEEGE